MQVKRDFHQNQPIWKGKKYKNSAEKMSQKWQIRNLGNFLEM